MRNILAIFEKGKIHESISFILFCILALSLTFSESFISIFSGLILIYQLISIKWNKEAVVDKLKDRFIWVMPSIVVVYIIGFLFTNDVQLGLYELKKIIFWFVLSIGIAISPKLSEHKFWLLLQVFVFGVLTSTVISFTKMIFSDSLYSNNFREINYISHIPFSFQITLSLIILIYSFIYKITYLSNTKKILRIVLIVWFLFFLVVLKSMLGLVAFYVTFFVLTFYLMKGIHSKKIRLWLIPVSVGVFLIPIIYIGISVFHFYTIKDSKEEVLNVVSNLGNKYEFNFNNKLKENGHYVYWFICEEELVKAWNARSTIKYDERNSEGYRLAATLKRYLTSKGLRKDSLGVAQLTERDIHNIQSGIANYIYDAPMYSIYPRVYGTVWELDKYFLNGNPNDQSLSQRIEYAKASINIIKHHFWFGIGTGNFKIEFANAFKRIHSKLKEDNYGSAHNQYLSYFLKFGIIGFLYILFIIFWLIYKKGQYSNHLFMLFFINMLVANLGDANWETHVGLAYFVFFFMIFLWHSPESILNRKLKIED